jgi:hypothetical protein
MYFIEYISQMWFLNGHINTQSNRQTIVDLHLSDIKVGMWCAISAIRIVGPILLSETINAK